MAAKKPTGISQIASVVFTTLLAPLIVSIFSSAIKNDKSIDDRTIVLRPVIAQPAPSAESVVTLLPPVGSHVSAYHDITAGEPAIKREEQLDRRDVLRTVDLIGIEPTTS